MPVRESFGVPFVGGVEHGLGLSSLRRCGESELGLNGPIPTRVDAAVKEAVLGLVEDAVDAGWGGVSRICGLLEVDRARVWRWKTRQLAGRAIHGLLHWGRDRDLGAVRGMGSD